MKISVYPLRLFLTKRPIQIYGAMIVLVQLLLWGYIFIQFPPRSETIFLHYNVLFGVDLVGSWWRILLLPIVGLVIAAGNGVVGWLSYQYDTFFSTVLWATAAYVQIILWFAVYVIVYLNV